MPKRHSEYSPCKDCIAEGVKTKRVPAFNGYGNQVPGGRCITHERARKKRAKARAHELRIEAKYELSKEDYEALKESQGGACFVCGRAKGKSKNLAVDHEHNKPGCEHAPDVGCRNCVRCLACTTCNQIILGRYSVEALCRAIVVLTDPPAQTVLNPSMS